jgi:hypothetical protein
MYGDTIVPTYLAAQAETPNTSALCAGTSICWVGEQTFATGGCRKQGCSPC